MLILPWIQPGDQGTVLLRTARNQSRQHGQRIDPMRLRQMSVSISSGRYCNVWGISPNLEEGSGRRR
ncbi:MULTISPECIES: hypothetical protein [Achromobacter]|uniref:hypothetical protein n=1 Tax=Achromobacter TaxID=222 RepID=UPI000B091550|nr:MULTISPECIES: hypothetical protein [Achromobacter]MBD9384659.1 hypothetical protein [Achromobacter sp. ACM02]MBD9419991.1 hypothetical protein [Achromobacter sp. ACM04]